MVSKIPKKRAKSPIAVPIFYLQMEGGGVESGKFNNKEVVYADQFECQEFLCQS